MTDKMKNMVLWFVIMGALFTIFSNFTPVDERVEVVNYSDFVQKVQQGEVDTADVRDRVISGRLATSGGQYTTFMPMEDPNILNQMIEKGVEVAGKQPEQQSLLVYLFIHMP